MTTSWPIRHAGCERNYRIVGLTPDNFVVMETRDEGVHRTHDRPSEYWGIEYLTRAERGILRRGLTPSGRDRERPKGEVMDLPDGEFPSNRSGPPEEGGNP